MSIEQYKRVDNEEVRLYESIEAMKEHEGSDKGVSFAFGRGSCKHSYCAPKFSFVPNCIYPVITSLKIRSSEIKKGLVLPMCLKVRIFIDDSDAIRFPKWWAKVFPNLCLIEMGPEDDDLKMKKFSSSLNNFTLIKSLKNVWIKNTVVMKVPDQFINHVDFFVACITKDTISAQELYGIENIMITRVYHSPGCDIRAGLIFKRPMIVYRQTPYLQALEMLKNKVFE